MVAQRLKRLETGAVDAFNCGNVNFTEVGSVEVIYTPSDNCRQFTRRFFAPTGRKIAAVASVMGPTANCTAISPSGVEFDTFSHGIVAIKNLVDGVVLDCRTGVNDAITLHITSYNQSEVCSSITHSLTPGSSASVGNYDGNTNYLPQQLCVWAVQATNASDNCNFTFVNTGVQSLPPGDFVTVITKRI
uniref:uncharacterized protein LOC113474225 isoform X2 n=1 Tax=Ciona intestinalis TaxID=7719 RepID=UPI000EF557E9|nr:uncharacterized protein LOC113474225 isoform X2 [Ciona intestinalis]|eukprot:XP_026690249.1 uncharacterized protein LOC113474225 isoform X2 [Ciona intestinalis]